MRPDYSTLFTEVYPVNGIHTYLNRKPSSIDIQPRKLLILTENWLPFWTHYAPIMDFSLQFVDKDWGYLDMTKYDKNFLFVLETWNLVPNWILAMNNIS